MHEILCRGGIDPCSTSNDQDVQTKDKIMNVGDIRMVNEGTKNEN